MVSNVFDLQPAGGALLAQASAFGGDTQVEYELKAPVNVVSLVTTTLADQPLATPVAVTTQRVSVDAAPARAGFELVSAPVAQGQRLEDAEIIVSGGRGLGKKENFELVKQMAEALGGMWGGSRRVDLPLRALRRGW